MIRKASVDIGTNSTRLLLIDIDNTGKMIPVITREHITRLGQGVLPSGDLSVEAMDIVLNTLKEFKTIIEEHRAAECRICATSATRDAKNRSEFLDLIFSHTGFRCRVLNGDEEAELSFLGVVSDLDVDESMLVCDVGGGSTEFIFTRDRSISFRTSLNIGSRRMTIHHVHGDPPTQNEIQSLRTAVKEEMRTGLPEGQTPDRLIVVGGTATTLAKIDAGVADDRILPVHHRVLSRDNLRTMIEQLIEIPLSRRKTIPGLNPARADVICAGALIIDAIFDHYDFSRATISQRDLLFGIFLEE